MPSWKVVWEEAFEGPALSARWIGGQLQVAPQYRIELREGLHLDMQAGGDYASGGVVSAEALAGDFAAEVAFTVSHPQQASTLELAAIGASPPPATVLQPTQAQACALVFNVHGEPPYVSAEFDEDDGWRIGWNTEPPVFKPGAQGQPIADSRHNRYGVNARTGDITGPASGWLWLERLGGHWRARGRATAQDTWLDLRPSPTQQDTTLDAAFLAGPVHLRLAAKHWIKPRKQVYSPPANHVVFNHFRLYRPA
ncbi:hypothetical protein [Ideonella livida]|uniref:Uncharacterized protein n=1 Tax=Ideonella livida TaxID=2707176 RepID=A0A7C9TIG8_9BURK|nr:hypothetical protein [Ideonella livida]NDY90444.1 hypothetical protein [Ideonella livida]